MGQHGRSYAGQVHMNICALGLLVAMMLASSFAGAQTSPPASTPQNQSGQNLQPLGTLPLQNPLAQQSSITATASGASAPQSNTIPSSQGKSFGTIGKGLPGMTGGPALTAPMGSQDPSSSYMRPTVTPPLFCDPSINIPC